MVRLELEEDEADGMAAFYFRISEWRSRSPLA